MAGEPHLTRVDGDGVLGLRIAAQGPEYAALEFQTSAQRQLKIAISNDRTRAIIKDAFPKCVASAGARSESVLRKRKPRTRGTCLPREARSSFRSTFSGSRENWTTTRPWLSRVKIGRMRSGWFRGDDARVDLRIVQRMRFLRRDTKSRLEFEGGRNQVAEVGGKAENDRE
jgi:hypothetical protein